jgi:outer membrane receptor protein involved in Fe transport
LDQEFIYVGDEGVVEPGGKTKRCGLDVTIRYEIAKNLFADLDLSFAKPRAIGVPKTEQFLPLAPTFTSIGGIQYRRERGWMASWRYRYMADRPANESNTVLAKGYFICDAAMTYVYKQWEWGLSLQNLLNTKWKETQFETTTQLREEKEPVSEIHFTPGTPFFAKISLIYHW